MFIPIVPTASHTTVINKTIVYSDTVLSLKDLGGNLQVCSISNVSESSLEICLKEIFESNPDVIFNTIQYSKQEKEVYFYTDKTISTRAWEESKFTKYIPLSNSKELLEEIARLLTEEKIQDIDCISLYDVSNLIKKLKKGYKDIEKKYEDYFKSVLRDKDNNLGITLYGFDYEEKQLKIDFKMYYGDWKKIVFAKQNEDLYIVKSESIYSQEVLALIGKGLSEFYDEAIKFLDFYTQSSYNIKSLNSNFGVNISDYEVAIYVKSLSNSYLKDFELSSKSAKDGNQYDYECNSVSVLTALQGKENEIFKRIFVKIDDCPEWSRQTLYQIRKEQLEKERELEEEQLEKERELEEEQLEKERELEEEQLNREMQRQRRLELKRKIFPWIRR